MRKAILQFLHRERDELRSDIGFIEAGRREILEIAGGRRKVVTAGVLSHLLDRLGRFEEMIATYESRLD